MKKSKFEPIRAFVGLVCAVNFLLFLLFYIPNYVLFVKNDAWYYFYTFFTRLIEFLLPALSATLLFVKSTEQSTKRLFIFGVWLTLPRFIYYFPYYYLYETAYGSDWIESILYSLLTNLILLSVYFIHIMGLYFIMSLFARRTVKREIIAENPQYAKADLSRQDASRLDKIMQLRLSEEMTRKGIFNFDLTVSFSILLGCIAEFVYQLIFECVDAVGYLVEYAGSYRTGEIIYMVCSFAFILVELVAAHVVCCLFKRLILSAVSNEKRVDAPANETANPSEKEPNNTSESE